jgi:hypothetical protein
MDVKYWDQITEGYPILNTVEKIKGVGLRAPENDHYEGLDSAMDRIINALFSSLGESSRGLFIGVVRGPVTISE